MRLRTHHFGTDGNVDYIIRLVEMVRRYEFLTEELLDGTRPHLYYSGIQYYPALEDYGDYLILAATEESGSALGAAKLLGVSRGMIGSRTHRQKKETE